MKKYLLAAALVLASAAALADTSTRYFVTYAFGRDKDVGALFSVSYKNGRDDVNQIQTRCNNQWNSYMSSTYKDYYNYSTGSNGYDTRSEAENGFRDNKAQAMRSNKGFDHAVTFSCTID